MKKYIVLVLALVLSLSLVACNASEKPATSDNAASGTSEADTSGASKEPKKLEGAIAEQPVLLTSVGQSAEVEMVKVMAEKQGLTVTTNSVATSADIGDNKTLLLAVGGSSKGLGAAGIDADGEIARATELISAAKEKGLVIIVVHMGGEARRGELSDKFIAPAFEKADYAIVTKDGNKDGLMTEIASENGVAFEEVASMADVSTALKAAFK